MIASFSRNFIFVKTRKTGGTSAEIVLSSWCRDGDICTPVTPEDEALRRQFGGQARDPGGLSRRCYNHMPATEIRDVVPALWAQAHKFTVDRHPYEKVLSRAWWNVGRRKGDPRAELGGEIDRTIASGFYLNFPLYSVDGTVIVDEVIRYEELWPRLASLAGQWGAALPQHLPNAKGQYRLDRTPAAEILTAEQKKAIQKAAAFEFELLGATP